MEITQSLRARKRAETEATLQRCALKLFVAKGYDLTTIEEIVADAEVSRRTFFRYFASKEDVIFKDADLDFATARRLLRERPPEENDLDALKNMVIAFVNHLEERKAPVLEFVNVILNSPSLRARSAEFKDRWTAVVAEELVARSEDPHTKAYLLAAIGIATITLAVQAWTNGTEPSLEVAARSAFRPIEDGTLFS